MNSPLRVASTPNRGGRTVEPADPAGRWVAMLPLFAVAGWVLGLGELGWVAWGLGGYHLRRLAPVALSVRVTAFLFMLTYLVSGFVIDQGRVLQYGYRGAAYLAVGGGYICVRAIRRSGSVDRVLQIILLLSTVLGLAAILGFNPSWRGPLGGLLPESRSPLLADWAQVELAQEQDIIESFEAIRPTAPFTYSNLWGAVVALVLLRIAARFPHYTSGERVRAGALAVAAVIPFLLALNRTAWGALVVGGVILALLGKWSHRMLLLAAAVAALVAVFAFGADQAISERLNEGHSDEGRQLLIELGIEAWRDEPIVGHGAPIPHPVPGFPSIGTHGQWLLIAVSQGALGLAAAGALAIALLRTHCTRRSPDRAIALAVFGSVLLLGAFYELLPAGLMVGSLALAGSRAS